MNIRAEKAFLNIAKAIDKFETGIIYTFQYGFAAPSPEDVVDADFKNLKVDLTYLLRFYCEKKFLTEDQKDTLYEQMHSPDRENWLLAFTIIDNLKHKLWTDETKT